MFPDYYEIIKNPISLAEIKSRGAKSEDYSLQDIYSDFRLLRNNALQYNEQESDISKAANVVLKAVEDYVLQVTSGPQSDTATVETYMNSLEQHQLRIMDQLANHKVGRSRHAAELFMDEPSREDYPDYYQLITSPISINTIRKQIHDGQVRTVKEFSEHVELMFSNACQYNHETSQVYADAKTLQKAFHLSLDKMVKALSEEPTGYTENASAIMRGEFPKDIQEEQNEEQEQEKEAEEEKELSDSEDKSREESGSSVSKTPFKLKLKTATPSTSKDSPKLKLNLKSPEKLKLKISRKEVSQDAPSEEGLQDSNEAPAAEPEETKEEPLPANDDDELDESKNDTEMSPDVSTNKQDPETGSENTSQPQDENKVEEKTVEESTVPLRNILRDPEQNSSESLIKSITVSSVIPITSKYHLQKSPPPPGLLNLFQINIPASLKYFIQSYAFSLPAFHHTININSTINEMLNHQYFDLILSHNYRQVNPYSSSTTSPWTDATSPITNKYEIQLAPGLNLVEITVSSQSGKPKRHSAVAAAAATAAVSAGTQVDDEESQADNIEKVSLWITLAKH